MDRRFLIDTATTVRIKQLDKINNKNSKLLPVTKQNNHKLNKIELELRSKALAKTDRNETIENL